MPLGLGRLAYPFALVAVVGTTWCFAWARSVSDASTRGYWPAKDPELMRRVLNATEEPADRAGEESASVHIESMND